MEITVKLDDLLYARRMTLTELADRVGITLANLSILKTGKAKAIRFSTLNALCRVLECQPGEILARRCHVNVGGPLNLVVVNLRWRLNIFYLDYGIQRRRLL